MHIDVSEHEKAVGASIGKRLMISDDSYDNLQEIIERYIIPCNRLVKEAASYYKYKDYETVEEFENAIKVEKDQEPARIPYKLTIFSQYP